MNGYTAFEGLLDPPADEPTRRVVNVPSTPKSGGLHGLSADGASPLLRAIAAATRKGRRAGRTELARQLHLSASGVTRALLPLEKRGIVRREPDPADGRASFAILTDSGRELADNASATAAEAATTGLMRRLEPGANAPADPPVGRDRLALGHYSAKTAASRS